jgi:hypothetical protein
MEPLPDGSNVLALIEKASWGTAFQSTEKFVSLQWSVVKPNEYANRKVFQKLWVTDDNPNAKSPDAAAKKRDKDKRMLATIDANAGGKLARNAQVPDDDDLTLALTNKKMVIKLKIWETDNGQSGNWVVGVSPATHEVSVPDVKTAVINAGAIVDDMDDDVPF